MFGQLVLSMPRRADFQSQTERKVKPSTARARANTLKYFANQAEDKRRREEGDLVDRVSNQLSSFESARETSSSEPESNDRELPRLVAEQSGVLESLVERQASQGRLVKFLILVLALAFLVGAFAVYLLFTDLPKEDE